MRSLRLYLSFMVLFFLFSFSVLLLSNNALVGPIFMYMSLIQLTVCATRLPGVLFLSFCSCFLMLSLEMLCVVDALLGSFPCPADHGGTVLYFTIGSATAYITV